MSQALGIQKDKEVAKVETKTTRKPHPIYGEWINVKVHPAASQDKNTDIWVSVNTFGRQFKPREVVSLPKGIVKLLKDPAFAGTPENYFDSEAIAEMSGKRGVHKTRMIAKYIVELVTDDEL